MNNLTAMLSRTVNKSTILIPTDDSKTYQVYDTIAETEKYYLSSYLCQNPINKKVLHLFTRGEFHITDQTKKIVKRESTDEALTFGSVSDLYDPPDAEPMQVQGYSAGYDSNGRLHIMVDVHSTISATGGTHQGRYFYSDDDGATLSSPVVIPYPVGTSMLTFRFHGHIRQNGNVLMTTGYFFPEEGTFTTVKLYVLRSTDLGASWTWIDSGNVGTNKQDEAEVLHISGNLWIMVAREEVNKQMWMFKSSDNGVTWLDCGQMSLEIIFDLAHPPVLHKFKADDGMDMAVLYFGDRRYVGNSFLYAWYAKCSNFTDGGVGAWNLSTRTTLRTDSWWIHYFDVFHYNNNMNARGAGSREDPAVSLEYNTIIHFELPAVQYASIHQILLPTSIYDLLNGTKAIYSWRGLVSNTTNDWGTVDSSNRITLLKSIRPGPLSKNLSATAGGILLGDGMEFDGTKALVTDDSSYFQPLHYSSAGDSDLNYTIYFTAKFGTSSNPNAAYGLFGNGGATSAAKGASMFFDDRVAQSRNNAFIYMIGKNTAGTFNLLLRHDNVITPNVKFNGCIMIDLSQTGNNKCKFLVNGVDQNVVVEAYNASGVITPTYAFQLGAVGNNGLIMVGNIYDWVWQNAIDIASVRNKLIDDLMDLEGL